MKQTYRRPLAPAAPKAPSLAIGPCAPAEIEKRKTETICVTAKAIEPSLDMKENMHTGSFSLLLDIRNKSNRRSPAIEAIYVVVHGSWSVSACGKECVNGATKLKPNLNRFLVTPNLRPLSPNAFRQQRVEFSKRLWTKYSGEEKKDVYTSRSNILVEVVTSEGTFKYNLFVDVTFDAVRF